MNPYPEHERLGKIQDKSQNIGEFLEWLESGGYEGRGDLGEIELGCYRRRRDGQREAKMSPTMIPVTDLLAAYFDIDQEKIEAEKRALLEECEKFYWRTAEHRDWGWTS